MKRLTITATVALLAFWPALVTGQYTSPDTPPDSPLWWPLFDGITAGELRMAHQEDAVRKRYAAAVDAGHAPDCGPDYVPTMFRDSGANPELVPLWHVLYDSVVFWWTIADQDADQEMIEDPPNWTNEEVARRKAGLSESGGESLRHFARASAQEAERRQELLEQAIWPMHDAIMKFEERNPPPSNEELIVLLENFESGSIETEDRERIERFRLVDAAIAGHGDPMTLSTIMDGSHADWSRWLEAGTSKPSEEAMAIHLRDLRESLSTSDWLALRSYLSTKVGNQGRWIIRCWTVPANDASMIPTRKELFKFNELSHSMPNFYFHHLSVHSKQHRVTGSFSLEVGFRSA